MSEPQAARLPPPVAHRRMGGRGRTPGGALTAGAGMVERRGASPGTQPRGDTARTHGHGQGTAGRKGRGGTVRAQLSPATGSLSRLARP